MPPGANRGASAGVFVKMRKPRRISSDSRELSSVLSSRGLCGYCHAAFIVMLAAMRGPVILIGEGEGEGEGGGDGSPAREQATSARNAAQTTARTVRRAIGCIDRCVKASLTYRPC